MQSICSPISPRSPHPMEPNSPTPSYNSDSTAPDLEYSRYIAYQPSTPPTSRLAPISPPPSKRRRILNSPNPLNPDDPASPSHSSNLVIDDDDVVKPAAVEAGEASVDDHLEYFSRRLSRCVNVSVLGDGALMGFGEWKELYMRNCHERGRHFVVHQHDHPVAGMCAFLTLCLSDRYFSVFILCSVSTVSVVSNNGLIAAGPRDTEWWLYDRRVASMTGGADGFNKGCIMISDFRSQKTVVSALRLCMGFLGTRIRGD